MENVKEHEDDVIKNFKSIVQSTTLGFYLVMDKLHCDEIVKWLNEQKIVHYVVYRSRKYKIKYDKRIKFDK